MKHAILETLSNYWAVPWIRSVIVILLTVGLAWFVRKWLVNLTLRLTARTETRIDDMVANRLRTPLYVSVIIVGIAWAIRELGLSETFQTRLDSSLKTIAILIWAGVGSTISTQVLTHLADADKDRGLLQPRTVPIFVFLARTSLWLFAVYLVFLAWSIDLTAWLASAGVLGIAIGFGAKDSLANLFAGVSILADSPFRVGDFITLEDGQRGRVTNIGMRSTRLLTPDEIEVIIPNNLIGNSRIVNETGGPGPLHRIRLQVSVAYGSDPELIRQVLIDCTESVLSLSTSRPPQAFFKGFGDSSLNFELLVWLIDPAKREPVIDQLNTKIYTALNDADVEIPYNKLDVYLKSPPVSRAGDTESPDEGTDG